MYNKVCQCGQTFVSRGPAARYCEDCKAIRTEEIRKENKERAERKRRARGCKVGRGAPKGDKHPNYRHGYYVAQTQARAYKEKVRYCERCGLDLHDRNKWLWCVHHKDHNHSNHSHDNLELLCKRCHQVEHECWLNFDK